MGFFDADENVDAYLEMVEGYDGRPLIAELQRHLPPEEGTTLLELGMGGGTDLDLLLAAGYDATGSDASAVFLRKYRERGGAGPTLLLDALTLETDQRFDGIFSNKVLHHFEKEDLILSLARQAEVVKPGGLLFHTLWSGEGQEEHQGMLFNYHQIDRFAAMLPASLEVVAQGAYDEMESGDSFWVALRRRA